MRAREFIHPVNEAKLDEFLPAVAAAVGRGAMAAGQVAARGAQVIGQGAVRGAQAVGNAVAKGAQAVGNAATKGVQAAGNAAQTIGQGVNDIRKVGQTVNNIQKVGQAVQQLTPQQQQQQQQQEIKSQQSMANTLPQLKNLGININPQQAQNALNKADSNAPLTALDKDNISKLGPAVGNIIRDPKLAGEFKSLLQRSQQAGGQV